jgi:hypothetical protein
VAADVEDRNAAFIAAARTLLPLLLDVAETAHAYLSLPPSIPHNAHHERARALGIALASLISATPPDA